MLIRISGYRRHWIYMITGNTTIYRKMAWAVAVLVFLHLLSPASAEIITGDDYLLQSMTARNWRPTRDKALALLQEGTGQPVTGAG